MSETDKALAEALRALIENMGAGKDFVLAQAPEVIQQLLAWELFKGWLGVSLGAGVMLFGAYLFRCARVYAPKDKYDDGKDSRDFGGAAMTMVGIVISLVGAIQIARILIAPKVFLLEYAARFA